MTCDRSRRRFLESTLALGTVTLAGCALLESDDHPPIDATAAELTAIAEIERPSRLEELPVEVGDERVEEGIERVETLLEPIPDAAELADEIPNEAVREYVDETRERARDGLEGIEEEPTNYARLSSLSPPRRRAAESEGAYAAATDDRTPDEVEEWLADLEEELVTTESALTRVGIDDESQHAVVVYGAVERELETAGRFVDNAHRPMPGKSTVEAVAELASRYERAAASLEEAQYLVDRQDDAGDRPLDDEFETAAADLLADLEDDVEELPSFESHDLAEELFDAQVEGTPRAWVGDTAIRRTYASYDDVPAHLENERFARALHELHAAETGRRAIDRLRSLVDDGGLERPDDADDVQDAKRDAIDAIETTREETAHPYLVGQSLDTAMSAVGGGDRRLERDADRSSDRAAVNATGEYAYAAAWARALPAATEWLVDALP
ncbi:hypothetical protein [Natronobacterium gregoryi]|uniref:Uncharacterized protein n=2 Tax=Natronobacterium gregoryi TaxID=44930 RepID=L0AKD1_NATGS|nr:hypothetical protein [Natronobacterium gregoryi]AFZ73515.1 hypothetical protein Natgr_2343 [Natronobacterium gregoryi SP2]ELY68371.1 hypothetical protein C490_09863 [Natronobacterium gregoryi SP2]PLK20581.1 hypothetical protein CYV19_09065 [Natronobacterium gregoryi SP2]SFJ16355.1 hypothetical protein SAMN05443661_11618 [Natronobacterium gregoryi]